MKKILLLTLLFFAIYSCGTYRINKTSDFVKLADLQVLNGNYIGKSEITSKNKNTNYILQNFNINNEKADFVQLTFQEPNAVKLNYLVDSDKGTEAKEIILKGERKEQFLEIYFSKKQSFIPLIYSLIDVSRIRIGQDKNGDLLIKDFYDRSGNILFFGAGASDERSCNYKKVEQYTNLYPTFTNDKWGYSNSKKEIVISPKYDFAYVFKNNAAKVKLNNKWGLINAEGLEICPIIYDVLTSDYIYQSQPIYLVEKNGKKGMLDLNGKEIIPVIYDYIDRLYSPEFRLKVGDKYGFATKEKIIIPAIYDEVESFESSEYVVAKKNGNIYLVDKQGFEYETGLYKLKDVLFKNQTHYYKPILSSKRKINFDEQSVK